MAEQIEKMGVTIETHYKKILQETSKLLANTEEELKKCRYAMKGILSYLNRVKVVRLAVKDMRKKLTNSRALYASHIEALQNVVSMHKAILIVGVEDMSTLASSDAQSIENYLASEDVQADSIFDDLWSALSTHQGEMAIFARELHQVLIITSFLGVHVQFFMLFFQALNMMTLEQTKSDAEKHIANISNLVSHHILRQKELVHKMIEISSMFILLLIQRVSLCSVSNSESAFKHYKKTNASVNEMCTKHVKSLASFIRDSSYSIEQHVFLRLILQEL
ncbi:Kinesin-like protein KIN-5C [Linum perenne]